MPVNALTKAPWGAVSCGILAFFGMASGALRGAEREVRAFQIRIGNRTAGDYQLTITRQDDGSTTVQADARVAVSYLVYGYRYHYHGTEIWRGDRLTQLNSSANDNGTRYKVTAAAQGEGLHVWTNTRNEIIRGDVWTTTYWKLPDARFRNQDIPLLDVDTGQELLGSLRFVDTQAVTVVGQPLECSHYHLTGNRPNGGASLNVELWYDPQGRLVREDSLEEGRHVIFELARLGQ